jgi:hypothetical protein
MTMWSLTQTNRFKAAVSGAGLSDWLSYFRRERGQAASCCLPRAVPGALMGGDSARRRMT